jgi:hypothetical protein
MFAARKRFVDIHDRKHLITSKKIRSRLLWTRFPLTARGVHPTGAAIVVFIRRPALLGLLCMDVQNIKRVGKFVSHFHAPSKAGL